MTMRSEIFVLIFLLCPLASPVEFSKPDQIIEVFRHGARGPFIGFDKSWEKSQKGKLTPAGMKQHYELGKSLFNDYPHLFDASQGTDGLYILANAHSRCVQSAFFQRAGLYSKTLTSLYKESSPKVLSFQDFFAKQASFLEIEDHFKTSEDLEWPQIQEVDESNAKIFQRGSLCPNGWKWEKENHNDTKALEAWTIFKDTIESVRENLPSTIRFKNSFDLNIIADAMMVNIYHNKSLLPLGVINEEVARNMTFAYSWFVFHNQYGRKVQRQLAAYPIVDEILGHLEAFRRGDKNHKRAALYSGHDYNIFAILGAFGVISEDCIMANFQSTIANETLPYPNCYFPYFASNLVFEFYNQTGGGEAYVRLLYNNNSVTLCGEQDFCPYEDFVIFARDSIGNLTPETYETACGKTAEENTEELLSSKPGDEIEKLKQEEGQKKNTIASLLAGDDNKIPSSQVVLRLNERMKVSQITDGTTSSILVIVVGWVALSALICFAIKSNTKSFRLHPKLDKKFKKKTSFDLESPDFEVKVH